MSGDVEQLRAVPAAWASPPAHMVSKLPKGGNGTPQNCRECGGYHRTGAVHLDYMGHADVTLALLAVDPLWTWEPTAWTDEGEPKIIKRADRLVLWGWMTVLGHRRLAVGTCEANKQEPEKELLGDALRNGSMRFGIGTALWSKGDHDTPPPAPPAPEPPARTEVGARAGRQPGAQRSDKPTESAQTAALTAAFAKAGVTTADERRAVVAGVIGRQVESAAQLTKVEAARVIDALGDVNTGRRQLIADPDGSYRLSEAS